SLNKSSRWNLVGPLSELSRIIREERPDVLYSFMPTANIFGALLKMINPRIKLIWGIRTSNIDLSLYAWHTRVAYYLEELLVRFPQKIIFNSNCGREYYESKGYPKEKAATVFNGIDTEN